MKNQPLNRLLESSQGRATLEYLTETLSSTDLQSLLLEVFRRRAARVDAKTLMRQFRENRFVHPSHVAPATMRSLDHLAYRLLPEDFEAVELSPLTPLGTCSAMAAVDQDWSVTTSRHNEVTSDPNNVMALLAAERRREHWRQDRRSVERVKLATSHRAVRPQLVDIPAAWSHFRLFALVISGRGEPDRRFETESLVEQIDYYIRVMRECETIGMPLSRIHARVTPLDEIDIPRLEREVVEILAERHPDAKVEFDHERTTGRKYYRYACFQVNAEDSSGTDLFLADGGFTDWTEKLLSDTRERMAISGLGTERLAYCAKKS